MPIIPSQVPFFCEPVPPSMDFWKTLLWQLQRHGNAEIINVRKTKQELTTALSSFLRKPSLLPSSGKGKSLIRWTSQQPYEREQLGVTSGFRREVDDNCFPLGYYATSSGNFLLTLPDNVSVSSSMVIFTPAHVTDELSRNVRKKLPQHAA